MSLATKPTTSSLPEQLPFAVTFKDAWGPILWWLNRNGFWAVPLPWPRWCYCLPGRKSHPTLIEHELVHYRQMARDGTIRWCIKYLWYAWKFGYWENPYEKEAYGISGYWGDVDEGGDQESDAARPDVHRVEHQKD